MIDLSLASNLIHLVRTSPHMTICDPTRAIDILRMSHVTKLIAESALASSSPFDKYADVFTQRGSQTLAIQIRALPASPWDGRHISNPNNHRHTATHTSMDSDLWSCSLVSPATPLLPIHRWTVVDVTVISGAVTSAWHPQTTIFDSNDVEH